MSKQHIPKVSIIIPVYKVEEYIADCIHSVIEQTRQDIEVILVDDKGEDRSIDIAKSLLSDSKVTWKVIEHDKNKGLSAARNSGVLSAQGKYLFFLDSDDYLSTSCIELLVKAAESISADMVYGNYIKDIGGNLEKSNRTREQESVVSSDAWYGLVHGHYTTFACNRLLDRKWYKSTGVNFIEGMLHEDELWTLELVRGAPKTTYVNDITYYYRIRPGSIMTSPDSIKKKIESRIMFLAASKACVSICPENLLLDYSVFHNRWIAETLRNIWESEYSKSEVFIRKTLSFLWIKDYCILPKIELTELRWLYILRRFMPDCFAYLISCKLVAKKILK